MGRSIRSVTIIAVLTALLPSVASADFKKDYDSALKAIEDQDWATAVQELEKAIAENPDSMERVRMYGMRFIPYLPHYHLGLARYQMGDCQAALAAWDEALSKGVIQSQDEFARLQQNRQACEAQVVDISAIAANARNSLEALEESIRDLDSLKDERLLTREWSGQSGWQSALEAGQNGLSRLRNDLSAAVDAKDADTIERITQEATRLSQDVQSAAGAAGQRLAVLRDQEEKRIAESRQQARRDLLQSVASAKSVLSEDAPDQRSRQLKQQLSQLVARSDQLGSSAATSTITELNRELSSTIRSFRQAVQEFESRQQQIAERKPPESLKQLAQAYFSGRYQDAVQMANPEQFSEERARIQALLFRAASRYNLYVLADGERRDLLQQAQSDIRTIKQMRGDFSPYVAAFPPKFTELFERTM